jgi:asparagine synthase (glutamine-hydrolysing)
LALPFKSPAVFSEPLRNLQFRDARYTKIPRALRFNDRVSMRSSVELREPFLDHRIFELAFAQPAARKINSNQGKWLLRKITNKLLPSGVVEAPKRPLQTPQREWLKGSLLDWVEGMLEDATNGFGSSWFDKPSLEKEWAGYKKGLSDNSFYVWQWISLGLISKNLARNKD